MNDIIRTRTTMNAWKEALTRILSKGVDFKDENGRICREILNLQVTADAPETDVAGPIQVLNGFRQWQYPPLEEISSIMLAPKLAPDYRYSYGPRIFNFQSKINQVNDFIIPLLKDVPNSRRAVLTFWDPALDSNIHSRDNPGLVCVDCKLRGNKLHLTGVVRSNDIFFGWPANILQLHTLQKYVAEMIGSQTGSITTFSTSAHIFQDQFGHIQDVLKR